MCKLVVQILILFTICVSLTFAQKRSKPKKIEFAEPFNLKNFEGWNKRDFYDFSLYLPKDLILVTLHGIDTNSQIARTEKIKLYIYFGNHSPTGPSIEVSYPDYEEKEFWINGIPALIWSYKDEESEFKYISSVVFYNDAVYKNYREYISFSAKDKNISEMADKIFNSVVFNKRLEEIK